ncbi:hypothetical protein GGR32_000156 [Mesonia hippocampi]|uniref:Uncharacterized protein n=1 Tax=Mesonia hippocampi TaxID=1628250 RepID=A0A840EUW9_9FLAO|nr:hypothetical protein [Mesonia hippocampi]MBB4117884.1 hypothetical protein [Mesonia hippocampi]
MTTHYKIESISTGLNLKVTYVNNKFKRVEHLKGKLDSIMLKEIGRIIPHTESNLSAYQNLYKGKINYIKIEKQKSLYTHFTDAWFAFYENENSVPPKYTGTDAKHLKQIIVYLKKVAGTEPEALATWRALLDNWKRLDEFHRKNCDLKYINSQLNKIIQNVQQVAKTGNKGISDDYLQSVINDLRTA